jgi:hypothetical protein
VGSGLQKRGRGAGVKGVLSTCTRRKPASNKGLSRAGARVQAQKNLNEKPEFPVPVSGQSGSFAPLGRPSVRREDLADSSVDAGGLDEQTMPRRGSGKKAEDLWQREVEISSINVGVTFTASEGEDSEARVRTEPWLELRGTVGVPIRDVREIVLIVDLTDREDLDPTKPPSVGVISRIRPAIMAGSSFLIRTSTESGRWRCPDNSTTAPSFSESLGTESQHRQCVVLDPAGRMTVPRPQGGQPDNGKTRLFSRREYLAQPEAAIIVPRCVEPCRLR